jgi:glycosyltransferase involved in cell wall biosynthesis
MISFIVIGKNIEHTIDLCLQSIFDFIKTNDISEYEIIYVDSDSSDSTVKLVQKYKIKIILIKGDTNAAVGRNQGAANSSGSILFFIDGDMEIHPDYFKAAFINDAELKYPFCTGDLLNKYYDIGYKGLDESSYEFGNPLTDNSYQHTGGGFFVIEKKYWDLLNGMDERFGRNEDLDFYLRMSRIGFPALRYKELFAVHHTVRYFDKNRIQTFLKSKNLLYYGLLIRKQIFYNIFFYKFIRGRYPMIILLSALININLLIVYLFVQLMRTVKNYKRDRKVILPFLLKIVVDIYSIVGCFYFFKHPVPDEIIIYP